MYGSGGAGDDTPDDHGDGKVDGGLADFIEEEVRGDLHEDIADEENRDCGLILCAMKVEVGL